MIHYNCHDNIDVVNFWECFTELWCHITGEFGHMKVLQSLSNFDVSIINAIKSTAWGSNDAEGVIWGGVGPARVGKCQQFVNVIHWNVPPVKCGHGGWQQDFHCSLLQYLPVFVDINMLAHRLSCVSTPKKLASFNLRSTRKTSKGPQNFSSRRGQR